MCGFWCSSNFCLQWLQSELITDGIVKSKIQDFQDGFDFNGPTITTHPLEFFFLDHSKRDFQAVVRFQGVWIVLNFVALKQRRIFLVEQVKNLYYKFKTHSYKRHFSFFNSLSSKVAARNANEQEDLGSIPAMSEFLFLSGIRSLDGTRYYHTFARPSASEKSAA